MVICSMPRCQTTAGCICGLNTAKIGDPVPMVGAEFVYTVPKELGRVTKLRSQNGRVIAETESGAEMIIPTYRHS